MSRCEDQRSGHSGNPPQSPTLPGKSISDEEGGNKPPYIRSTESYLCVPSGRADTEGLCGQRRLGDFPLLRGPRAGHPDRTAAPASLLASVLPPRAERGRIDGPGAPRVRERGPRQQPRPQQVPAPGRFYTLNNEAFKKKKKRKILVNALLREAEMKARRSAEVVKCVFKIRTIPLSLSGFRNDADGGGRENSQR